MEIQGHYFLVRGQDMMAIQQSMTKVNHNPIVPQIFDKIWMQSN